MLYALLCYNDEDVVWSWDKATEDTVMRKLEVVRTRLESQGKLGPSLRLMPTTAATTWPKLPGCRSLRKRRNQRYPPT